MATGSGQLTDSGRTTDLARAGRAPALVTGFGLGAFVDGIVLQQILQWHHLVVEYHPADTVGGLETNTFWDGVFHLASWAVVLAGCLWLASRAGAVRALGLRRFAGMLLVGAGAFNIVDQLLFHLALQAHHIRMVANYQVYDWSFFGLGVLAMLVGLALGRGPGGRRTPR